VISELIVVLYNNYYNVLFLLSFYKILLAVKLTIISQFQCIYRRTMWIDLCIISLKLVKIFWKLIVLKKKSSHNVVGRFLELKCIIKQQKSFIYILSEHLQYHQHFNFNYSYLFYVAYYSIRLKFI